MASILLTAGIALTEPPWSYVPKNQEICITVGSDSRWGFLALPEGKPPANGFPVYIQFVIDLFSPVNASSASCSSSKGRHAKKFHAFDTPDDALRSCFSSETNPWPRSDCDYDQQSGAMWDQRLKQYLVANKVAVLQLNPRYTDLWDNSPLWWDGRDPSGYGGADKLWLTSFFAQLKAGRFGPLDASNTVLHGWSGGAQMVSWMTQVLAVNGTALFPGVSVKGGVMLSGGSYTCYNDKQSREGGMEPVGTCKGCVEGGPEHCQDDAKCSSCDAAIQPYCDQCCPRNFTEQFYHDHPDQWPSHPPMFLGQTSSVDNHADLCACKNYHETLVAHGVKSELHLVPKGDEACFCVGTPLEPAAAGSPWASECKKPDWGKHCSTMGGTDCCITHTQGFAAMVEPATQFVLDVLST